MLSEKLNSLIAEAMKAGEKERTYVLRLIKTALVNVEKSGVKLTEDIELKTLMKMITQREDSIKQYTEAKRVDLAEQEAYEISVIKEFVPEQPSDDEVNEYIDKAIADYKEAHGVIAMKDMKPIMETVKAKYNLPTVGKLVSNRVKAQIA